MKIAVIIARVLLGLAFVVFGANGLHPFMPMPPMPPGPVADWIEVMGPTGWMKLIALLQVLGGLFVLTGRLAPIGLVFLGPILVNILAFHLFLDGGNGLMPGLIFTALEIFLIYAYRGYFKQIFTTNAKPTL